MVSSVSAQTEIDTAALAADLRGVIGQLVRRLRRENLFPLNQASVLGRLDRCGSQSVSDLAAAGLIERNPDPDDRRRALVILTRAGKSRIEADRRAREGWLAKAFEEMPEADLATIERTVEILRRVADADV
jgi:hypothetical protein